MYAIPASFALESTVSSLRTSERSLPSSSVSLEGMSKCTRLLGTGAGDDVLNHSIDCKLSPPFDMAMDLMLSSSSILEEKSL
ncbi:hypothetical protein KC19_10G052100 [Ceratodon purpureus]|uniref:Uncharacterized protein n=1 Tax=Ceratodon purpureus TaxID=3225 RepID=A0A8T0GKP3_CERPU|nr:hypothetical protein KC19_10G052100 [Ceratodon purpureus]